ncbi:MAG: cytochrome c [Rhodospirillales bacterium]|nr:cytochrome c [Rhodospirillales bacterium]
MREVLQLCAAALFAGLLPMSAQAQSAPQEGVKLFQENCVSCHTIGGGRLVGPDLLGVAERRSDEWLTRFIADPERMRKDDPIAMANVKIYGAPMPQLGLTEPQVAAIIAFFKTAEAAPDSLPRQYVSTLLASLAAIVAFTLIGLVAGSKKADGGVV